MSDGTDSDARPPRPTGLARVGRTTGVTIFWVVAVYFVGMSFYSVGSELFGDGLQASMPGDAPQCAAELQELSTGLHQAAGQTLTQPIGVSSLAWLRDWDRRLAELQDRCGVVRDRQQQLADVRSSVVALLRRHQRESAPNRKSLERALDALIPSS